MRDNCIVIASFELRASAERKRERERGVEPCQSRAESRLTRFFLHSGRSARRCSKLKLIPVMRGEGGEEDGGNGEKKGREKGRQDWRAMDLKWRSSRSKKRRSRSCVRVEPVDEGDAGG